MEHSILQIGCLVVVLFIAILYNNEKNRLKINVESAWFELLLGVGVFSIIFDGLSAYTVNHLNEVPAILNTIAHIGFYIGLDLLVFIMFLYMLHLTDSFPRRWWAKVIMYSPLVIEIIAVFVFIGETKYYEGTISWYSMGISAYTCFGAVAVYSTLSVIKFIQGWRYMESRTRSSIGLFLGAIIIIAVIKFFRTELLITAIAPVLFVVGIYINQENPVLKEIAHYQSEMIMGFATLVENRDDSTGSHVRRTSKYVELLALRLRQEGFYRDVLTKDYIQNLIMAAPIHDIGKISVPDGVLQKPGSLTTDEYHTMKRHALAGGKIIQETFGRLEDEDYLVMAYEVSRFHHEKWDGTGYPEGLKGKEIPLCARIMAIADVFDAISENRCYREAMPLEQCFRVIENGRGTFFEPIMVDVFLEMRDRVEAIHNDIHMED